MIYKHQLRVLRHFDRIQDAVAGRKFEPVRVLIYPTDLCNYACPWCESQAFRAASVRAQQHTLPLNTAKNAIFDAAMLGAKVIHFAGGGEPMLHPQFGELVLCAKGLGLKVAIDSNGSQIEKWHEALLHADNLRVSLNAVNAEQYAVQTGGRGDWEKVLSSLRALCAAPGPEIGLSFVVSACNRAADFEALQREVGADYLFVREERGETVPSPKASRCYFAETVCEIAPNGDVHACCERRDVVFGNLHEQRLREIWGSAEHQARAHAICPQLCQRCVCDNYNEAVERFVVNDEARSWLV